MIVPRLFTMLVLTVSIIVLITNGTLVVHAEETPVCRGDSITISAVLLENITYGDPIPNQKIEFYDESNDVLLGTALTDDNGVASIQWNIPMTHPLGETLINSTFRGNDSLFLDPSAQWTKITIFSQTDIIILSGSTLLIPGDNISIKARLVNDIGNGVSNISISAFINDQYVLSTFTNSSGYFEFEIGYDSSIIELGTNIVKLITVDSEQAFYLGTAKTVNIEYRKLLVSIDELEPVKRNVSLNSSMSLVLYLYSNDIPMSKTSLDVIIDEEYFGTWITNNEGIVNISITIDEKIDIGKHVVEVQYLGNYKYSTALLKIEFDVYTIAVIETLFPQRIVAYSDSSFIMSIRDVIGRPFKNITIGVIDSVSNYTYWIKTKSSERFQVPYIAIGSNGQRTLTVIMINQEFISNKAWNITINVWSRPSFKIVSESIQGYAMPMQRIFLTFRLEDNIGPLSEVEILISREGKSISQITFTNKSGWASIDWIAQFENGLDSVSIIYQGNNVSYYLSSQFKYEYQVSNHIPVDVLMISYNLVIPLKQISIYLLMMSRNGTFIKGLNIVYQWLEQEGYATSDKSGRVYLDLPMPSSNGTFLLYYETFPREGLAQSSGTFSITINQAQAQAVEGVGIHGLLASCMTIIISAVVPLLKQRYLIGS